jgi:radical SAM superfamily enzyme YgiQ (UPF0313 family)
VLREFAEKWREKVGLPFFCAGITPTHISSEKVEILLAGGLNRVRMGVQSGSDRVLKFYRRPNRPGLVKQATDILGVFANMMVPPNYDIIVDNPIETADDVQDTLRLINNLPRPFTLNIFSLRYIPNTQLGSQLNEMGLEIEGIERNYWSVMPTFANALLYLVATFHLPQFLFDWLAKRATPYYGKQPSPLWGGVIILFRSMFYAKRAWYHIRNLDFSPPPRRHRLVVLAVGAPQISVASAQPLFRATTATVGLVIAPLIGVTLLTVSSRDKGGKHGGCWL